MFYHNPIPEGLEELEGLSELATDLRWTWSHFSDRLWEFLDPVTWERTQNPYLILQSVQRARLEEVARDKNFRRELLGWVDNRRRYLEDPGWFGQNYSGSGLDTLAYFSMEFGLGEPLPIYSGGLGILAGDHLKAASDLSVPITGVGLLYQQGYFRQVLSSDHWQLEAFPYNDPTILPVVPVQDPDGGMLRVRVPLPGRELLLRVWQACVGKVSLYLLDTNDPLNSPWDRGITANLYPAEKERRLIQEIVLGFGGWLVLEKLDVHAQVCHLNEGHAAFAVLARAHSFMKKTGTSFSVALRATRAGNVFTTHTPVEAAFDRFDLGLIRPFLDPLAQIMGIPTEQLLILGCKDRKNPNEPFNMAYLAMRGSGRVNGVSRLHGTVSRRIFQALYPHWPSDEIPVGYITNGVHIPSWDSKAADHLWTRACGKDRWLSSTEQLCRSIERVDLSELWRVRAEGRQSLIQYVRNRLIRQMRHQGASSDAVMRAQHVLDPDVLTLGFARRFTNYKRPTLLLHDPERLKRILKNTNRPVQLIVAGKAHPNDLEGKKMVQAVAQFAAQADLLGCMVFLEDYDMTLAQELAAGIDVWINTPRRPMEACGTSGMKVLVNGGLNLSELDGWWAEAYTPKVGWAIGDGREDHQPGWDAQEANQLYSLLEQQIIPEFYNRDEAGIPRAWMDRVRASMSLLTPDFSSNRMLREYVEKIYLPAAQAYRERATDGGNLAKELEQWNEILSNNWQGIRFGDVRSTEKNDHWFFEIQVYLDDVMPDFVNVELYAEPQNHEDPVIRIMTRKSPLPGSVHGFLYIGEVPNSRPANHYTPRVVPYHPKASIPLEGTYIRWLT